MIRIIETWTDILGGIGAFLLLPLVGAMIYEVLSRHIFGVPTLWAYELAYMMMGTIFMFGIAFTLKRNAHVNVDLFYENFEPRTKAIVSLLGYALLFPFVIWVTYALFWYAVEAYVGQELSGKSAWNPVVWPYRVLLVIGFATFALQILSEILKSIYAAVHNQYYCGEV